MASLSVRVSTTSNSSVVYGAQLKSVLGVAVGTCVS